MGFSVCVRTRFWEIEWPAHLGFSPQSGAGFVSPARKRWEEQKKSVESRRDGTVLTHTL